jgi:hypothetical protein
MSNLVRGEELEMIKDREPLQRLVVAPVDLDELDGESSARLKPARPCTAEHTGVVPCWAVHSCDKRAEG